MMKRLLVATAALTMAASAAQADMKVGVLVGFTGPIDSLTPNIAAAADPQRLRHQAPPRRHRAPRRALPPRG